MSVFDSVEKVDMLGEPLADVPMPYRKEANGVLRGGDLVDILDMLSRGKTPLEMAGLYNCSVADIEAFIIKNKNASILRCEPKKFTGDNVTRPTYSRGKSP